MEERTVRAILRLAGVLTIFVGLILATTTLIGLAGMRGVMVQGGNMHVDVGGMMSRVGTTGVLSSLSVSAWGLVLYWIAPKLAARVTE